MSNVCVAVPKVCTISINIFRSDLPQTKMLQHHSYITISFFTLHFSKLVNLAKEKYLKGRRARDIEIIVDNMKHYPESEGQWLYDLMNDLMPKSSSQRKGTASGDRSGQLPLSLCFFWGGLVNSRPLVLVLCPLNTGGTKLPASGPLESVASCPVHADVRNLC